MKEPCFKRMVVFQRLCPEYPCSHRRRTPFCDEQQGIRFSFSVCSHTFEVPPQLFSGPLPFSLETAVWGSEKRHFCILLSQVSLPAHGLLLWGALSTQSFPIFVRGLDVEWHMPTLPGVLKSVTGVTAVHIPTSSTREHKAPTASPIDYVGILLDSDI